MDKYLGNCWVWFARACGALCVRMVLCAVGLWGLVQPPLSACLQESGPGATQSSSELSSSELDCEDWPRFLGRQIDGIVRGKLSHIIPRDFSGDGLRLLWQVDVQEGYAMGVVSANRYFHFDKIDDSARLRSLDALTGKLIWEYKYPSSYRDLYGYDSGPRSSPLVDGERVYVFGVEGKLICLNKDSGDHLWTVDTAETFGVIQNFFGVSSNPVIHENKIIVMVGGSPKESAEIPRGQLDRVKPNNSAIVAFDKMTGDVVYQTGDDLASYCSLTWMGNGPGKTLIAWCRAAVHGIDPGDGRVKFTFPWRAKKLESVNAMTPVVDGDHFLISECYELGSALVKVENEQCRLLWSDRGRRKKSLAAHWGTPVLRDGYLYGCSGRHTATADLRCVELSTGDIKWVRRGFGRCSVLLLGESLVVLGEKGELALVEASPQEFKLVSQREANSSFDMVPNCWAAPIAVGNRLYVRDGEKVGCFEIELR